MKKYTIVWSEQKKTGVSASGRAWAITEMTLKDEDGVETSGVSTFESVMTGGSLEGEIVKNEKGYLNFKAHLEPPKDPVFRKPNMDRIIEKKQAGIAESQDRKEQSIAKAQDRSAWMWAKTNASTLLAGTPHTDTPNLDTIADTVIELATKIYNAEPTTPFN